MTKTSRPDYRANSNHKRQTSYLSSNMAAISGQTPPKPRYVSSRTFTSAMVHMPEVLNPGIS
jgi:hypothetical protein